jgi:hypothetical protein
MMASEAQTRSSESLFAMINGCKSLPSVSEGEILTMLLSFLIQRGPASVNHYTKYKTESDSPKGWATIIYWKRLNRTHINMKHKTFFNKR